MVMAQQMSSEPAHTITLSSEEIESAIKALSSAGQALRLTFFQWLLYQALMISADVSAVSFLASIVTMELGVVNLLLLTFMASVLVTLIFTVLNGPLILKTIHERS